MATNLLYQLRLGGFLVRWALYVAYGLLQFVSKPGSRSIVPLVLAAVAYATRTPLEAVINGRVLQADWQRMPEPLALETGLALGVALVICVGLVLPSCLDHVRGAASILWSFVGLAIQVALLGCVTGVGLALYYGLPLDTRLFHYLPFDITRFVPSDLSAYIPAVNWRYSGHLPEPVTLHAMLIVSILLVSCIYVVLSRMLVLVLGTFPPLTRPLRPLRSLRIKASAIRPVVVRIAVPALPRRKPMLTAAPLPVSNIPEG